MSFRLATLERWFTCIRLSNSYLTHLMRLLPCCSLQELLTHAAHLGLRPIPADRPRRAYLHLSRSLTMKITNSCYKSFRASAAHAVSCILVLSAESKRVLPNDVWVGDRLPVRVLGINPVRQISSLFSILFR